MASGLRRGSTVVALAVVLSGCAGGNPLSLGNDAEEVITVGSQGTPESEILAQLYGQVLEQAGFTVHYRQSIGTREEFLDSLGDGSLDFVVDYAGELMAEVDARARATSIEAIEAALPAALKPYGVTALHAGFADTGDVLVATADFAAEHSLTAIADLAPIASDTTLGADSDFEERWADDLVDAYGLDGLAFAAIDDNGGALTVQQLLDGVIDVARLRASDPAIIEHELVVLADSANVLPDQNVLPLLGVDLKAEEVAGVLDAVSVQLTTADLALLRERYQGEEQPRAADLAAEWLVSRRLLD